jgi:hypothetical protein
VVVFPGLRFVLSDGEARALRCRFWFGHPGVRKATMAVGRAMVRRRAIRRLHDSVILAGDSGFPLG